MIRSLAGFALAAGLGLAMLPAATQEKYPNRPIKIIVPFPAGGPIDVMARLTGQKLSASLGQVIVENRPGGGSTIGLKAVASAEPDGHTLLYGGQMTLAVLPAMSKSLDNDSFKGFSTVALVSSVPFVLVVGPHVPARTVQELVAYARAYPGKLNFGAPTGATPQLVGELFKLKAGVDITFIPYRGAAGTVTDMLTGQIDLAFEPTSVLLAHIHEGKTRPLAVTSATRSPLLPEIPTMAESGVAGVVATSWTGLVAPTGTPPAIVGRLNGAINDALKTPDMAEALRKLGADPLGGSPQDFTAMLAQEAPKWIELVKAAGIKID